MKLFVLTLAAGAVLAATNIVAAGPSHLHAKKTSPSPAPVGGIDNPFSDNFDSYAAGSGIAGQGGWQLWGPTSPNGWVDNAFSASSPNSLRLDGESDVVQVLNVTSGKWRISANTYYPAGGTAHGMLIGLNTFPYTGLNSWSTEIMWNWATGNVHEYDTPGENTPILFNQWVPVRIEVDLDTDTYNAWYNNVQIVTNRSWSAGVAPGGAVRIQCWDFYVWGFGSNIIYFDDIVFEAMGAQCYANCDGSTTPPILNVEDFTCFINQFAAGTQLPHAQQLGHYANCDQSTTAPVLNVEDFTCFINRFAQGCP
jgi:hypothetical protein